MTDNLDSDADQSARVSTSSNKHSAAPDDCPAPSPPASGPEPGLESQTDAPSIPAQEPSNLEPPVQPEDEVLPEMVPAESPEKDHPMSDEPDLMNPVIHTEDHPMNGLSEERVATADEPHTQLLEEQSALPADSAAQNTTASPAILPRENPGVLAELGAAINSSPRQNSPKVVNGHASSPPAPFQEGNADSLDSEDEILIFRPSVKRRRTTTTRPQPESVTSRFVADFILDSSAGKADLSLHDLIASLKDQFAPEGVPPAERVRLLEILGSGRLQGQALQYIPPEGKGINLSGKITMDGKIACGCSDCCGNLVSLLEFEEHSGAWQRYQTQCVYLPDQAISLKDLWVALNSEFGHMVSQNGMVSKPPKKLRHCRVCKKANKGLMKCGGGCRQYVHAKCVGLTDKNNGPWSCLSCMEDHIQREVAKAEEARQKAWQKAQAKAEAALLKAENRRTSMKFSDTPKNAKIKGAAKAQTAPRLSNGSKPQRVHMAAPTAKAGLTKGRMVRNSNKHKRLFDPDEPNGVKSGQHVVYKTTQGEILLEGEIRVSRDGPCGILCEHCNAVISCSAFEAHAGRGSRRAPYDNIFLNGIALRKLAQALPAEEVVYYPSAETSETVVQEDMMGGCVLCEEKNFQREGFSNLTVILCDGCEREYHIKCLQEHKNINLECLPEGDWFCSPKCQEIHHALRERVSLGLIDLNEDYQWQLLHGKDGTTSTTWQLKGCQDILEESFDPIIDQISKQNLVKGMVYSEQQGEWDHSGMFAAVLKYKKQNVCALVMRAFGDMLAEVPLIATKTNARRRGHARYLMDALGNLLAEVGVKVLSLPAAHATVETWTAGFGFKPMSADSLLETRESLRLLVFPGTEVLYKPLRPEGDPYMAPRKPKRIQAAAEELLQIATTAPPSGTPPAEGAPSPQQPANPQTDSPALPKNPLANGAPMDTSQAAQNKAPSAPSGDRVEPLEPAVVAGTGTGNGPAEIGGVPVPSNLQQPEVLKLMTDVSNILGLPSSTGAIEGADKDTPTGPPQPPIPPALPESTAASQPPNVVEPTEQSAEQPVLDHNTEQSPRGQPISEAEPVTNGLQLEAAVQGQAEIPGLGESGTETERVGTSQKDAPGLANEQRPETLPATFSVQGMKSIPPHQPVVS